MNSWFFVPPVSSYWFALILKPSLAAFWECTTFWVVLFSYRDKGIVKMAYVPHYQYKLLKFACFFFNSSQLHLKILQHCISLFNFGLWYSNMIGQFHFLYVWFFICFSCWSISLFWFILEEFILVTILLSILFHLGI